jgi:hypothetical protein
MPARVKSAHAAVVLAFILAGCTTELKVARHVDEKTLPTVGAPYSLSFTQYDLKMTRRLVACDGPGQDMKVGIKLDITSAQRPDPTRMYVIDLESLDGFFKTTGASVEYYDGGAIKSLNGSAEDKAGEFVASVATTVGKLVTAGVIGGAGLAATEVEPDNVPKPGCSGATRDNLRALAALEAEVEQRTAQVDVLTSELTKVNAVMAADKTFASRRSRRELGDLQVKLIDEIAWLNDAVAKTAPLLKALGETREFAWPPNGETFVTEQLKPPTGDLDRTLYQSWLRTPDAATTDQAIIGANALTYQRLVADSTIHLQLERVGTLGRTKDSANTFPEDKQSGFKYRIPAPGKLRVCADPACAKVYKEGDVAMVSQLGHVYVLPLKSTMFSSKTVKATFAENGTPTSIGLTSAAAADKAGATLAAVGDLAATVHKSRAEQELNDVKARTELLKAKKDLADATAALQPSPGQAKIDATSAFKVDTDLAEANLAYLKATQALEEARRTQAASGP